MTTKIVVTGGNGFLGKYVMRELNGKGWHNCKQKYKPISIRSSEYDLTEQSEVRRMYRTLKPDIVIHLAAVVGGIGINQQKPGTFFYKNLIMGTMLMEEARKTNIDKFVAIGTICAYPKYADVPFKEDHIWEGYPEETNAPYGLAKKMMLVQSQSYRQEFDFNSIYLLPVNLYGPGDNFDLHSSHVIPALIRKFVTAKREEHENVELWGTGKVTREFIYASDAARAIVIATEEYNSPEPINIGSGREIQISELAEFIQESVGYTGNVIWNNEKPDGQPRRCLDVQRAEEKLGFKAMVSLERGIEQTIKWYKDEN